MAAPLQYKVSNAFVVVCFFATTATIFPLETSDNCYDASPLRIGAAPKGQFLPTTSRIEAVCIWVGLSTALVAAPHSLNAKNPSSLLLVVFSWALGFAGLVSIAGVHCEDDKLGLGFWFAHLALALAPWCVFLDRIKPD